MYNLVHYNRALWFRGAKRTYLQLLCAHWGTDLLPSQNRHITIIVVVNHFAHLHVFIHDFVYAFLYQIVHKSVHKLRQTLSPHIDIQQFLAVYKLVCILFLCNTLQTRLWSTNAFYTTMETIFVVSTARTGVFIFFSDNSVLDFNLDRVVSLNIDLISLNLSVILLS